MYNDLLNLHAQVREDIIARLNEFRHLWEKGTDQDIFIELVFCLMTPQSRARACWGAVERLVEKELLMTGSQPQIAAQLSGVRFHNVKAQRLIEAREQFFDHDRCLRGIVSGFDSPFESREWLVSNINGLGYKEASHFLRNIGIGQELAILDRHILRNLVSLEVIDSLPSSISGRTYLEIEKKMARFAKEIDIPIGHLDLLLWYKEAGEVFK